MNNEEFAQKNTCCLKKVLVTGASGLLAVSWWKEDWRERCRYGLVYSKAVVVPI